MKKWGVTVLIDASTFIEVEAETEAEAIEKALEEAYVPSICHHCSHELELGDILMLAVLVVMIEWVIATPSGASRSRTVSK